MKKVILWLAGILMLSGQSFPGEGYIFPLKEQRELSSIFADHRNFHFHSGIDFKTGEKTGLEVYAAKSGWVYRLFASWWGYGKAVYLQHPDGELTLYAHLSDFSDKLRKIVTEEQLKNKRYRADIFPQDTIWITQGELIGYSGETGTGEPHFHFEIRDKDNRPLNPLTSGLSIQDTIPPVFTRIGLRPLDQNSFVDTSAEMMIYPLHFDTTEKAFVTKTLPLVEGNIGVEVSAYDQMVEKGSRFGIYKLELFLDSLLLFSSHYDTIDFDNTWKIELDRDFELLKNKEGEFYKLYLDYGNDLPLYHSINRGFLEFPDSGLHQLVILAQDASGNISRAKVILQAFRPQAFEPLRAENPSPFMASNQDKITGKSQDGLAIVEIEPGSVFRKVEPSIERLKRPEKLRLKPISPIYSFSPAYVPLAKQAKVSISYKSIDSSPFKTALYKLDDSTFKTEFIGQEIDTVNKLISGMVRDLSIYALLEDKKAPEIKEIYPGQSQRVRGEGLIISAKTTDNLSGIGSDLDIEIYLDREWQIPEYDPEKSLLISKPLKVLSPGWHKLTIKARDRMGNLRIARRKFKII